MERRNGNRKDLRNHSPLNGQKTPVRRPAKDVEVRAIRIIHEEKPTEPTAPKQSKSTVPVPEEVRVISAIPAEKSPTEPESGVPASEEVWFINEPLSAEKSIPVKVRPSAKALPNRMEISIPKPKPKKKTFSEKYLTEESADLTDLKFAFINVAVMAVLVAAIVLSMLFLKRSSGFSESENRDLAKFPKFSISALLNGEFTAGVSEYYNDTVPSRETIKSWANSFKKLYGISGGVTIKGTYGNVKKEEFTGEATITKATAFTGTPATTEDSSNDSSSNNETSKTTPATTLPVENDDGKLENGIMVIGSGANIRALELYGGSFSHGEKYAEFVNNYKEDLGQYVNVYNMCIPTASAFYLPEKYKDEYGSQIDNINNIRSYLKDVIDIDAYSALDAHTDEKIYSRTDHHWQPIGAYYAAQVFAQDAGVDFAALSTYEKVVENDFVGTLYGFSGEIELKNNPEDFIYYKPANNDDLDVKYYDTDFTNGVESQLFFYASEKINLYSSFLGKDEEIAEIDTNVDNNRVLVIFKDSFGNALVPFLTGSFSKIYVCDIRYFDVNAIDFCKDVGATDVLFAMSMFSNTSDKINYIENNRVQ